jgi:hypothetical protein
MPLWNIVGIFLSFHFFFFFFDKNISRLQLAGYSRTEEDPDTFLFVAEHLYLTQKSIFFYLSITFKKLSTSNSLNIFFILNKYYFFISFDTNLFNNPSSLSHSQ